MSQAESQPPQQTERQTSFEFVIHREGLPADILEMRARVLRDETRLLADADLSSIDDEIGTHICVYHQGILAGAALGVEAERSTFPARTGISPDKLKHHYYTTRLMVAPEFRHQGLAPLLMYGLFREGRILGRRDLVGLFSEAELMPARLINAVPFRGLTPLQFTGHEGHTFELQGMVGDVNYGMYRCWAVLRDELRALVVDRLLADEVIQTVLRETARFYENPWFQRVEAGTLTRGQYIECLANNHQFVRWTTRILARIAGLTEDNGLRNHYLHHLFGEIDHEKIIESDLAYLGADVEYIREHMSPCVDIGHFMGVQEGLVGFRGEPTTMLAVPLAIESLTAHLSGSFLDNLEACVRKWGYEEPSQATAYLRSHVPLDGGDDGHWERTRRVIHRFIKTEPQTQRFVGIVRMVVVALDRALRSYVERPDFS